MKLSEKLLKEVSKNESIEVELDFYGITLQEVFKDIKNLGIALEVANEQLDDTFKALDPNQQEF